MLNAVINGFDLWTTAQSIKTSGRGRSAANQSLHGINKLRELILELTVRGKLVPQEPNDESADLLLKKVVSERNQVGILGKASIEKQFPEIGKDEIPYRLPNNWSWTRIGKIGHDWGQKEPNSDFTYIEVSAIDNLAGKIQSPTLLTADNVPSRARKIVKVGTVIYSTVRPYLKNICVIEKEYVPEPIASTAFAIIHPYKNIHPRFIYYYLKSPVFVRYVESVQTGIAYPAINDKQFFSGLIPIPPSAEQHRIVAKVDELMAVCDQLEHQQTENNTAHEILVESLLQTLHNTANNSELVKAWQRIAENFDTLFTTEHSIDRLKETILQLAVMGKLVPQVLDDEPATELLKRISIENYGITNRGKKKTALSKIDEAVTPYHLPSGWEWVRLHQIIKISSGDGLTSVEMNKNGNIPVFGGNGITGYHDHENIRKPTLVIGRVGYYCGSIHITPKSAWVTDNAFITIFSENNICLRFLYWLLKGTNLKENENATAQPVISGQKIYPIVVGLPPISEQYRIADKLDELIAICDTLKSRISEYQHIKIQLADAVVEMAVK